MVVCGHAHLQQLQYSVTDCTVYSACGTWVRERTVGSRVALCRGLSQFAWMIFVSVREICVVGPIASRVIWRGEAGCLNWLVYVMGLSRQIACVS